MRLLYVHCDSDNTVKLLNNSAIFPSATNTHETLTKIKRYPLLLLHKWTDVVFYWYIHIMDQIFAICHSTGFDLDLLMKWWKSMTNGQYDNLVKLSPHEMENIFLVKITVFRWNLKCACGHIMGRYAVEQNFCISHWNADNNNTSICLMIM